LSPKQKYFRILGIPPTTDKSVIKKAYRKLAFKYHPDVNNSAEAQAKFIELTDAYDILLGVKNISKRRGTTQAHSTHKPNVKSAKEERDERIKAAKARYKKAKEKELEGEAMYYLNLISGWKWRFLKTFSIISFIFLALLVLDFVLPTESELFVVHNFESNDMSGQLHFKIDNSIHFFDVYEAIAIKRFPLIELNSTPIFNDLKSFSFLNGPNAGRIVEPMFCYLYFFPLVVILLLIPLVTVLYKKPTPIFSIFHKISFYISPLLFLIVCLSNWRIFQIFL
jgi:hypothetical protein